MTDELLWQCNETELIWLARNQGLGHLRRGLPKQELVSIVAGYIQPEEKHFSDTRGSREVLERFVEKNWGVLRSQLPGCDGKCMTYSCTEGKHALCFFPNEDRIQTS